MQHILNTEYANLVGLRAERKIVARFSKNLISTMTLLLISDALCFKHTNRAVIQNKPYWFWC